MSKKKKPERLDAHNALKSLESKWLKDQRLYTLEPIQTRVAAAKVAAVLDFAEQHQLALNFDDWPLAGLEELVKMDQAAFKQCLANLRQTGIVNRGCKLLKPAADVTGKHNPELFPSPPNGGQITYRCVKPGGVTLPDRDEYVLEEQEVAFSEKDIEASQNLQHAIANEWLVPQQQ